MRGESTFEAYWDGVAMSHIYLSNAYYNGGTQFLTLMPLGLHLKIENKQQFDGYTRYHVLLPVLDFDKRYYIEDDRGLKTPLQFGRIVESEAFDAHFATDAPLGAVFNNQSLAFSIWAPTADWVYLKLLNTKEGEILGDAVILPLQRMAKGVWHTTLSGDTVVSTKLLEQPWVAYRYMICSDGICRETQDPYGHSTLANAQASVVIKGHLLQAAESNPGFWQGGNDFSPLDAAIYEVSVRDFTQHSTSGASYPGTYEGMSQQNLVYNGMPVGRDYLKELGISHVQLLPVYDFGSVDELAPRVRYNWGYDPIQYFCPEGSLSAVPQDPLARVKGLQHLVAELHRDGFAVNMDVVYNHMFDKDTSPLEKVVPGYYFRVDKEGKPSNGSFCGNDLDSTRKMMRRLILDCTAHWMKVYGFDGFRFDLMGILDRGTMLAVQECVTQINPFGLVYGEGWNMPTALDDADKAMMDHALYMPEIGFFNDRFRDFYKGETMTEAVTKKGLLTGLKASRAQWVSESGFKQLFISSKLSQHIQYMECHDNHTLYDKLVACCPRVDEAQLKTLQRSLNAFIALSFGVPFFHCGQEWYRSKGGDHNSYRAGDVVNAIDWSKVSEDYEGTLSLRDALRLRRKFPIFREDHFEHILVKTRRTITASGLLVLTVEGQFTLLFNLTAKSLKHPGDLMQICYTSEMGMRDLDVHAKKNLSKTIPAYTIRVLSHM